jgi:hypothetical protein
MQQEEAHQAMCTTAITIDFFPWPAAGHHQDQGQDDTLPPDGDPTPAPNKGNRRVKPTQILAHCADHGHRCIVDLARSNIHVVFGRRILGACCQTCGGELWGGAGQIARDHDAEPALPGPVLLTGTEPPDQADDDEE